MRDKVFKRSNGEYTLTSLLQYRSTPRRLPRTALALQKFWQSLTGNLCLIASYFHYPSRTTFILHSSKNFFKNTCSVCHTTVKL